MKMRMKKRDSPLKKNYRKLWLKERIDKEFIVQTFQIRKSYHLPIPTIPINKSISVFFNRLKKTDMEYVRRMGKKFNVILKQARKQKLTENAHLAIVDSLTRQLPSMKFYSRIELLAKETGFSKKWVPYLILYLIADKIIPPTDIADEDAPPPKVVEDYSIFIERKKANALKKYKGKNAPTYLNIGQKIIGDDTDKLTFEEISSHDKKIINFVKKRYQRFIEKYNLKE